MPAKAGVYSLINIVQYVSSNLNIKQISSTGLDGPGCSGFLALFGFHPPRLPFGVWSHIFHETNSVRFEY
jgi:hypothetical protein